jgi:hypothetical protein
MKKCEISKFFFFFFFFFFQCQRQRMLIFLLLALSAADAVKEVDYDAPYDWDLVQKHTNVNSKKKNFKNFDF